MATGSDDRDRIPSWLLPLSLGSTAFVAGSSSTFHFGSESFIVPKAFALALTSLACALFLARRALRLGARATYFEGAIAAYFVVGLASWGLGTHRTNSLLSWVALNGAAAIVFWAASVASRARPGALEVWIVWIAVILSAIAIPEALGAHFPWATTRRPASLLGNRNFLGAYVAVAIPFAVTFALAKPRWNRIAVVTLLFTTLVLTRCRSAWLGVALAGGVALAIWLARRFVAREPAPSPTRSRRGAVVGAAILLGVTLAATLPWPGLQWAERNPIASTARRVVEYDSGSGQVRVMQLRTAMAIARSRPLGVGPMAWDDAESAYAREVGEHPREWLINPTPSSDVARVLAELGVLGVLAGLLAFTLLVKPALTAAVRASRGSPWGVTALAGITVCAVHSLLDAPLFRPAMIPLFAMVAGIVNGLNPGRGRERSIALPRAGIATGAVVGGLACAIGPTLLLAATLRGRSGAMADTIAAQAIWPRVYVSEAIAKTWSAMGVCDRAKPELDRLLAWTPHHLGPYRIAAKCAEDAGDHVGAEHFRAAMYSIDPSAPAEGIPSPKGPVGR